jgi:hypothetical protein
MYRVWIDYHDGTSKRATVSTAEAAVKLLAQWESEGLSKDSGYGLSEDFANE